MKEQFVKVAFRRKTIKLIEQANEIIVEMRDKGFTLTVRQLYYQFVARALLENKAQNYQRLASVVDHARKAGLIDWSAIEDRTRFLRSYRTFENPSEALHQAAKHYMEDLWRTQSAYVEVWIEKDALLGVIEPACGRYRIPYFACRGYASSSELYAAGRRIRRKIDEGKRVIVLHLGDHDPSGVDMSRVNNESIRDFGRIAGSGRLEFRRLALNMDQIEQYNPPENFAKESDSRHDGYKSMLIDDHGYEEDAEEYPSWELDALDPEVIDRLIRDQLDNIVDPVKFEAARLSEQAGEGAMQEIADEWGDVTRYLTHRNTPDPRTGYTPDEAIDAIETDEEDEPNVEE